MTQATFTRTTAPLINARAADTPTFERQKGLVVDGSDKIDGGTERVDLDRAVETGMALDPTIALTVEQRVSAEAAAMERFMSEELEVVLHEPSHESEAPYFECRVNGDYICARRDTSRPVKMKRYHVAVLAQAKTARLTQRRQADSEGFQSYAQEIMLRQSYPFSVIHDPSGKRGADWLRPLISARTV